MNESDDRNTDAGDDAVMAAARALPKGIAPGRDLWPAIAESLAESSAEPSADAPITPQH